VAVVGVVGVVGVATTTAIVFLRGKWCSRPIGLGLREFCRHFLSILCDKRRRGAGERRGWLS